MITKQQVHSPAGSFVAIDAIQPPRRFHLQPPVTIAVKVRVGAAAQYAFISGHPLHSQLVPDVQDFFRQAPFRGPHPARAHAEDAGMQFEGPLQLFARIFRMAESLVRQRQSWAGNAAGIAVAKQRQDGMIKG